MILLMLFHCASVDDNTVYAECASQRFGCDSIDDSCTTVDDCRTFVLPGSDGPCGERAYLANFEADRDIQPFLDTYEQCIGDAVYTAGGDPGSCAPVEPMCDGGRCIWHERGTCFR